MSQHAIELGDVIEVLRGYQDNAFDAVLCDPPYGLSFMGKKWDYDVPSSALWAEVLRVCKPGAPLIAFSGTRTYHRTVVAIEDAGWEIRDQLAWMYGSGFPKSLDVSKAIDAAAGAVREAGRANPNHRPVSGVQYEGTYSGGNTGAATITAPATESARAWAGYGTALKPAYEPAVLARKPLEGTVAANVAKWGVGALAIDACRIEGESTKRQNTAEMGYSGGNTSASYATGSDLGRWPANVLLDEEAGAILDAQTGDRPSTLTGRADPKRRHASPANSVDTRDSMFGNERAVSAVYADSGGASRFFYCPKSNRKERDLGCEGLPLRSAAEMTDSEEGQARLDSPRTGAGRTGGARNHHPTVKPIALMTYLARLLLPPKPGAILVPFSGSGSEMLGCLAAGWPAVLGIERDSEYVAIAQARLKARAA